VIQESGDAHNRVFTVAVKVNGKVYAQGTATKKRDAQKQAATLALNKLGLI